MFIRAVCSRHIKYSLLTVEYQCVLMRVVHIHLLHTGVHNQTERKANRAQGFETTSITCGLPVPFE